MSKPRVILHMLPTLGLGGGQTVLLRNIGAGDPGRFRHVVCHVRGPSTMARAFRDRGAATYCLRVASAASQAAALGRLLRLIAREQVDLIHTNNTIPDVRFGAVAAAIARLPVVNTLHTDEVIGTARSTLGRLQAAVVGFAARRTFRHAVAVSTSARDAWLSQMRRMGLGREEITVVTPGVRIPERRGDEARVRTRAQLSLNEKQPVLIHVGRLVEGKGQRVVIEALPALLARWPDLVLLLVGDGPARQALREAARAAGLNGAVRFLGERNDVPDLLAATDLFVFPSRTEGFGLAPLEALASGVPVVAYDLPTLRRFVVPEQTGRLVCQGDQEGLVAAIEGLLADPAARADMGERGRSRVAASFDERTSARAIEDIYEDVLGNPERTRLHRRPDDHRLAHLGSS